MDVKFRIPSIVSHFILSKFSVLKSVSSKDQVI